MYKSIEGLESTTYHLMNTTQTRSSQWGTSRLPSPCPQQCPPRYGQEPAWLCGVHAVSGESSHVRAVAGRGDEGGEGGGGGEEGPHPRRPLPASGQAAQQASPSSSVLSLRSGGLEWPCLSFSLSFFVSPSVYRSVNTSVCRSIYTSAPLHVCLSVCLGLSVCCCLCVCLCLDLTIAVCLSFSLSLSVCHSLPIFVFSLLILLSTSFVRSHYTCI